MQRRARGAIVVTSMSASAIKAPSNHHASGSAMFLLLTNGTREAAEAALGESETAPTLMQHLASAQLWFESFQNWQSEFLSTFVLIALAVYLHERGSPASKPAGAPHSQTGTDEKKPAEGGLF